MKEINQIKINVSGKTSIGKSHVMTIIKKALKAEYFGAQVSSYDLEIELDGNSESDLLKPRADSTVFWISESNNDKR